MARLSVEAEDARLSANPLNALAWLANERLLHDSLLKARELANHDGYVPFGTLMDYTGGRSDGCTSWSPSDAQQIIPMVKDNPTTVYIYPESHDIDAVAQAIAARQSPSRAAPYWNVSCLKGIGSPRFWPRQTLEPILAQYKKAHPAPPRSAPICKEVTGR